MRIKFITNPFKIRNIILVLFSRNSLDPNSFIQRNSYFKSTRLLLGYHFLKEKRAAVPTKEIMSLSAKCYDGEEKIEIHIRLPVKENGIPRSFLLSRSKKEDLGSALKRLKINILGKVAKKGKRKKCGQSITPEAYTEENFDLPIEVLHNGKVVDPLLTNEDAWVEGCVLRVGDDYLTLEMNPPVVKIEKLPKVILARYPVFPNITTEFCQKIDCQFYWMAVEDSNFHSISKDIKQGTLLISDVENTFMKGQFFTPESTDVGKYLAFACIPINGSKTGKLQASISTCSISEGPIRCPFEDRHQQTQTKSSPGEFRVVSYNILAEMYADTTLARTELFHYCPSNALDMPYRQHLILKELQGYQADIICLQEVDKSIFKTHLSQAFELLNYFGLFRPKKGSVSEGCAMFIAQDKFEHIAEMDIVLSDYLSTDPSCADIWKAVTEIPVLKEKIVERSSILQVNIVRSVESPRKYVCIANTHLYFYPTADNIRLIHAATALRYIQTIYTAYKSEGQDISMVFCGDFNTGPACGVFQLFSGQFVPSDHVDWEMAGPEEQITNLELSQSMNIESACGIPEFTNFTAGFKHTLDYIFIDSDKLGVTKTVPFPDKSVLEENKALPSVVFPSDHLALVCDLKFK